MKGGLYFRTLQGPTSVTSSAAGSFTGVGKRQILVNRQNSLEVWEEDDDGELHMSREVPVYERVEHCAAVPGGDGGCDLVLIVTSDDLCCLMAWAGDTFKEVAATWLEPPPPQGNQPPPARRLDGVCASSPFTGVGPTAQASAAVVAVDVYEGYIHMVSIGTEAPYRCAATSVPYHRTLQGVPGGGPRGGVSSVVSMELVPSSATSATNPDGHHLLAVLYAEEGFESRVLHLQCVVVDVVGAAMRHGPWTVRNVHPTTSLVLPAAWAGHLAIEDPSSALVVSSRGIMWFGGGTERGALAWELQGKPTCAELLAPGLVAVGDSSGSVSLADVRGDAPASWGGHVPITCGGGARIVAPAALSFVPRGEGAEDAAGGAGLMFVGSHMGSSQVLEVPLAALGGAAPGAGAWGMQQAAAISSLAPVVAAMVTEQGAGGGGGGGGDEAQLLLCCGAAPTGALRRGVMGASLHAVSMDGPEVGGGVRLLPVRERWAAEHHTLLLFSFDAMGCTDALRVEGEQFEQVQVEGLDHARATLHAAPAPGDLLLQATIGGGGGELRVVGLAGTPGLRSTWAPPPAGGGGGGYTRPIDLCASLGGAVAVSCGADVFTLQVDPDSGAVHALGRAARLQQVSALGVFTLGEEGERVVAMGQWVDNTVCLASWPDMVELGWVAVSAGQPRSVLVAALQGVPYLLVGTAGGDVVYYTVRRGAGGALAFTAPHQVHVGSTAVSLELVAGGGDGAGGAGPHVYAHGSRDVVLWSPPSLPAGMLQAARVHGSAGLGCVAALHTAEMPHSMVWVSARRRRLVFGQLDLSIRLRWETAPLGDTPIKMARHKSLGLVVLLTEDAGGRSWLRLLLDDTLEEVAALQLDPDHVHCAVLCADLPCTSRGGGAGGGGAQGAEGCAGGEAEAGAAPGLKEFIVLSSFIQDRSRAPAGSEYMMGMLSVLEVARAGGGAAEDASFQLVLHGTAFLNSICYSLATVSPPAAQTQAQAPAAAVGLGVGAEDTPGAAPPPPPAAGPGPGSPLEPALPPGPLLLAGCHSGAALYHLVVDDAGRAGARAVGEAIDAIRRLEPEPTEIGMEGGEDGEDEAGSSMLEMLGAERWDQRVVLEHVGSVATPGGGCVTALAPVAESGGVAVASEFLGSIALLQPDASAPSKVRVCASDRLPLYAHASAPLTDQCFLVAAHPYGLVLLERDLPAEAAFAERAKLEEQRAFEAGPRTTLGRAPPPGAAAGAAGEGEGEGMGDGAGGGGLQPDAPPGLLLRAACRIPQLVVQFCRGRLGLRARPVDPSPGAPGPAPGPEALVYVTAAGQVGSVQVLPEEEHGVLSRAQAALEGEPHAAAAGPYRHESMWRWRCPMPDSGDDAEAAAQAQGLGAEHANAAAVDGDFVARLLGAGAGVGAGRALLGGAGAGAEGGELAEKAARLVALADFRVM